MAICVYYMASCIALLLDNYWRYCSIFYQQVLILLFLLFLQESFHLIHDLACFRSIHISMDSKMSTELATYAVCFHLFSGFLTYCCCRSLSNLTEMNSWIISLALFQQLFSGKLTDRTTRRIVLAFLALLCVQTVYLRPTSLLLWMPIMAPWLWMQSHQCWREDEKFWVNCCFFL